MYVRKEALLSSQIEGTQSSLSDLLLFENDEIPLVPIDDVQEVSNYVAAMNYGLERIGEDSRCRCGSSGKFMTSCCARGAAAASSPVNFADPELDRRYPARQRLLRAAASPRDAGLPR